MYVVALAASTPTQFHFVFPFPFLKFSVVGLGKKLYKRLSLVMMKKKGNYKRKNMNEPNDIPNRYAIYRAIDSPSHSLSRISSATPPFLSSLILRCGSLNCHHCIAFATNPVQASSPAPRLLGTVNNVSPFTRTSYHTNFKRHIGLLVSTKI